MTKTTDAHSNSNSNTRGNWFGIKLSKFELFFFLSLLNVYIVKFERVLLLVRDIHDDPSELPDVKRKKRLGNKIVHPNARLSPGLSSCLGLRQPNSSTPCTTRITLSEGHNEEYKFRGICHRFITVLLSVQ